MDDPRALIIERDLRMQRYLLGYVSERGCQTVGVSSVPEALARLASDSFSFTLVDLDHEAAGTHQSVSDLKLQAGDPGTVIALTDMDPELAPSLAGVDRYIGRASLVTDLDRTIETALGVNNLAGRPAPSISAAIPISQEMALWTSQRMQAVRAIIEEAAGVDVTVLVTGETGTGKDIAARAIHALSARSTGPFVKVNCAAVPRELLESELFGHERGAFTGAHKLNVGKFQVAHRGTIFLDEIGDLHPALQAKLLHVLQDGQFSRIGGQSTLSVDVRVLAATNQDLELAVAEGRFREDLYYRLNVIHVYLPPLRERVAEIPVLANYFIDRYAKLYRRERFAVPPSVMERLMRHRYPGNVRELENLVKRMIVLGDPFMMRVSLPEPRAVSARADSGSVPAAGPSLKEIARRASQAAQRDVIAKILEQTGGNRTRAARVLRISYRSLLYKIKDVGLKPARSLDPGPGALRHKL